MIKFSQKFSRKNYDHPKSLTYYPVTLTKYKPKYEQSTNLRLLHMRSKIRRLVTEVTDEPEGSAQLTPPLTPPDGEKYRKSRRNSERYNTTTHS